MTGSIFDVEEFAVYDGPGIRMVIFLKGCPLRCNWCHNPEGLSVGPQRITSHSLCVHCGTCDKVCPSPKNCIGCRKCEINCPNGCCHVVGCGTDSQEIADKVNENREILTMNGGGVTFSGGEPLLQPDFVVDLCSRMPGVHKAIETSGYAESHVFRRVISAMDYVIMDVKIVDSKMHRQWTGVDNGKILHNLEWLKICGKPFRIRIPLIPGVNDTEENMSATAELLDEADNLDKVELLPYHKAAGAKYQSADMVYTPRFDTEKEPEIHKEPFLMRGIEVNVL